MISRYQYVRLLPARVVSAYAAPTLFAIFFYHVFTARVYLFVGGEEGCYCGVLYVKIYVFYSKRFRVLGWFKNCAIWLESMRAFHNL